ncbi:MAG TPA: Mur ligase family protein [Thermoanaerobaculia bacterium]|nr:Mur ligase family protein [Thermoanaerobaculia bacterium]
MSPAFQLTTDPDRVLARLEALGIRLGLDRLRVLLAALGDPQARFPSVLVAGSNGKGSTSALLAAMAGAAGYRVGHYTSPHLESVEERIRIDGRAIERARLAELIERVVAAAEADGGELPTYFEALTAAAFLAFAEDAVELAVLEVGMGGRLDATNVVEPVLSVITPISLEHREYLGPTLAAIAREKAGILRRGRPAVAWVEKQAAERALLIAAEEIGAELNTVDPEVWIESVEPLGWAGQEVHLVAAGERRVLRLHLLGEHQAGNLVLAMAAAAALQGAGFPRLTPAAIAAGAEACRWPGRLEPVELPDGRRVLLDAAHNPAGIAVLTAFLDQQGEPFDLLFGVLADKPAGEMLPHLDSRAERIVLTQPTSPRARPAEELAALMAGRPDVHTEPDPTKALDLALAAPSSLLVACGSIVLVGELRTALRQRFNLPPPAA